MRTDRSAQQAGGDLRNGMEVFAAQGFGAEDRRWRWQTGAAFVKASLNKSSAHGGLPKGEGRRLKRRERAWA